MAVAYVVAAFSNRLINKSKSTSPVMKSHKSSFILQMKYK